MPPFCGWPGGGGVAAGFVVYTLLPYDFAPNPVAGQNNPPRIVTYPLANTWFSTAIEYPNPNAGGSWAQCAHLTSPYTDPTVDPWFSLCWATNTGPGTADFHMHHTCHPDSTPMAPGGPGVSQSQATAAINDLQVWPEVQIAPTGVGSVWGPNSVVNINLYRGSQPPDTIAGPVYVFAVRLRYAVL